MNAVDIFDPWKLQADAGMELEFVYSTLYCTDNTFTA